MLCRFPDYKFGEGIKRERKWEGRMPPLNSPDGHKIKLAKQMAKKRSLMQYGDGAARVDIVNH